MRVRVGGALLLAALLAGCAENRLLTALQNGNRFAMAPAAAPAPPAPDDVRVQADPSFRLSELKLGLTKAELEVLYPNRLVLRRSDRNGRNRYYFVEPPGVTTGTKVERDRLALVVTDGRLAAFDVVHSDEEVMGATEIAASLIPRAPPQPKAAPPAGKFAVQIASRNSEAEARALIDEMRAKYPVLLGRQWAAIYRVALPQGVVYRVVIGPLGTAQQALQLCAGLKAQGTECFLRKT